MIFVVSISAPFVTGIHLQLPREARMSKDKMLKYTQLLPPGARIDITVTGLTLLPKTFGTKVSELRPHKSLFSIADLKRYPQDANEPRSALFYQRKFYVGEKEGSKRSRAPGAWDNIMQQIRRNSSK